MLRVSVACSASCSGLDEIEYCLTRIDGRSWRYVGKGMLMSGCCSRMSRTLSRTGMTSSECEVASFVRWIFVSSDEANLVKVRRSLILAG
jgi:hypothetical protein